MYNSPFNIVLPCIPACSCPSQSHIPMFCWHRSVGDFLCPRFLLFQLFEFFIYSLLTSPSIRIEWIPYSGQSPGLVAPHFCQLSISPILTQFTKILKFYHFLIFRQIISTSSFATSTFAPNSTANSFSGLQQKIGLYLKIRLLLFHDKCFVNRKFRHYLNRISTKFLVFLISSNMK